MKKLPLFNFFAIDSFLKDKQIVCVGVKPGKDYETGETLGTKVEGVIAKDKTDYGESKDGEKVTNLFERLTFKIPEIIDVPLNVEIVPVNPVAKVYGEYQNQLSITADGIQVVGK